jgi:hypothetical protein
MFLDDDENVKMMRETAREVGLVRLLLQAAETDDVSLVRSRVLEALRLLGVGGQR